MGRQRGYDEGEVLDRAAATFLRSGYEGTSIEELVQATGLHRGSLYQAFGSKRGLFVGCLRRQVCAHPDGEDSTDLVLVALLELAPRDEEVRVLLGEHLDRRGVTATDLGRRLLTRALMDETKDDRDA
ncbi:MAG TPA: helix-turn-helix domain-containing protein [Nocardioides sp.]|nr:helix-turn-helix domain-containing protein [Nocardioides sp.]